MSYRCEITGKARLRGNRVSHANNKTIHFQRPNLQERRLFVPELGRFIKLRVSVSALRTLDKVGGLTRFLLRTDCSELSPRLKKLKKEIIAKGAGSN
jgi:large subunit ribosomal protein L28